MNLSNRFDGWKLYPYARALDAAYEVRGHYLYRCEVGAAPELEISRDRMDQPRPLFELRPANNSHGQLRTADGTPQRGTRRMS